MKVGKVTEILETLGLKYEETPENRGFTKEETDIINARNSAIWWVTEALLQLDEISAMSQRGKILNEAKTCVCSDREKDYGTPEQNFGIIADLWSHYTDIKIKPEDVACMMILLKVARVKSGNGKHDNWVDIAGYAACGGEIQSTRI